MERITLYEYDRRNMSQIEKAVTEYGREIVRLNSPSLLDKLLNKKENMEFHQDYYYDFTPIIISEGRHSENWAQQLISFINIYFEQIPFHIYFILDSRYSNEVKESLYLYIDKVDSLEVELGINETEVLNVVDISDKKLCELQKFVSSHLFGNQRFQTRLFQELINFRLFNKIGIQKIFSVFICGESGVGKTETARLLHLFLSPNENFIKINLGNYSDKNALSSLIGSPRGYIGSSKGELSDKIFKSKAKVILIDEFEKAGGEVRNFFLELLEDGKFTDSLGREFDLNKYIIIFTSNIKEQDVNNKLSPELQSRFSLMYRFSPVSENDKQKYLQYKISLLLSKISDTLHVNFPQAALERIYAIDVRQYHNLRKMNKEIMLRISQEYQNLKSF